MPHELLFSKSDWSSADSIKGTELFNACPKEFKTDNPWSDFAEQMQSLNVSVKNWRWKSPGAIAVHQMNCLCELLKSDLAADKKFAIAGWMLCKMLERVPVYIPAE